MTTAHLDLLSALRAELETAKAQITLLEELRRDLAAEVTQLKKELFIRDTQVSFLNVEVENKLMIGDVINRRM